MKNVNIFIAVFSVFTIISCGKDDKTESKSDNECENKVESRNDSIIVSGKCEFEPNITFLANAYLITINEKPENALSSVEIFQPATKSYMGVKASSASALRPDGWYSQASIWKNMKGTWKWSLKATNEYRIVFAQLPLQKTPATVPVTYSMSGQAVVGPIHLNGSHTFNISCPDAKLAGFTAELYDGNNGGEILNASYYNILEAANLDEDNKQINNYSKTIQITVAEGNYLITVTANRGANWTVSIN